MIHLHYWATPNGHKITIFLEEAGLPYRIHPVNIMKGDQHKSSYLKISPNHKMPAIIDDAPVDSHGPLSLFESGAILWYLAEKAQTFVPQSHRLKTEVSSWLFWQVGSLGPMSGQDHHFKKYAPEQVPYAIDRYAKETARLYKVLDKHLDGREWVAADMYTIADMAIFPWIEPEEHNELKEYPALREWQRKIAARPAVQRAYRLGESFTEEAPMTDEARKHLFAVS